jgi:hypothetical protein
LPDLVTLVDRYVPEQIGIHVLGFAQLTRTSNEI